MFPPLVARRRLATKTRGAVGPQPFGSLSLWTAIEVEYLRGMRLNCPLPRCKHPGFRAISSRSKMHFFPCLWAPVLPPPSHSFVCSFMAPQLVSAQSTPSMIRECVNALVQVPLVKQECITGCLA